MSKIYRGVCFEVGVVQTNTAIFSTRCEALIATVQRVDTSLEKKKKVNEKHRLKCENTANLVNFWQDFSKVVSVPNVDVATESSRICRLIWSERNTHDALDFSHLKQIAWISG